MIKRRSVGQNASTIKELVESIGDRNTIRVRMRELEVVIMRGQIGQRCRLPYTLMLAQRMSSCLL